MSTPLGQIDPNRIQLNRQAREAYQVEQDRIRAEQERVRLIEEQRRLEEERRRQEETRQRQEQAPRNRNIVFVEGKGWEFVVQPTYEDPTGSRAVTKEEVNPAYFKTEEGKQLQAQFDATEKQAIAIAKAAQEKDLFGSGSSNPANVFNLAKQGIYDVKYSQDDKGLYTSASYKTPVQQQQQSPSRADETYRALKSVAPSTAEWYAKQVTMTPEQKASETAAKAQFDKEQGKALNDWYNKNLSPAAFQQQINAQNREIDKQVQGWKQKQRELGYGGAVVSIYEKGKAPTEGYGGPTLLVDKGNRTYAYSLMPLAGRKQYEYRADPLNPYDIKKVEVTEPLTIKAAGKEIVIENPAQSTPQPFEIKGGFAENFVGYFENIGKTGEDIAKSASSGRFENIQYNPEVEGQSLNALITAGKNLYEGKQQTLAEDFGQIGSAIAKNPAGAAGSIAASVLFTVGTLGASKVVTAAKGGMAAFRGASQAERAGLTGTRLLEVESDTVRAVRIAPSGELVALSRSPLGYFEVAKPIKLQSVLTQYQKTIKVPTKPQLFAVEKETQDVGYVGAKSTAIITEKISPEAGRALTKKIPIIQSITEVTESEARVLPKVAPPSIVGKLVPDIGQTLVKTSEGIRPATSQPLGVSIVEFANKDLLKLSADESRRNAQIAAARKALGEIPGQTKAFKPFEAVPKARLTKASSAPLEVISAFESDRALKAAQKAAVSIVTEGGKASGRSASSLVGPGIFSGATVGKLLGGNATSYTPSSSLGFGGDAGQSRVLRKQLKDITESVSSLVTPETSPISTNRDLSKLSDKLLPKSIDVTKDFQKSFDSLTPKVSTSLFSQQGTGLREDTTTATRIAEALTTGTVQAQRSAFDNLFRVRTVTPTRTRIIPPFNLPFRTQQKKKGKKKKERKARYGEGTFTLVDILEVGSPALAKALKGFKID